MSSHPATEFAQELIDFCYNSPTAYHAVDSAVKILDRNGFKCLKESDAWKLEKGGKYSYCPIFDNGAGLLSNVQFSPLDIDPKGLIREAVARPMGTTFTRQMNTARGLFGQVLQIRKFDRPEISEKVKPLLEYYSKRDGGLILDRVEECILVRQKYI